MSRKENSDLFLMSWNILAPCWVNKDWYPYLYELAADYQTRINLILSKIRSMNCDLVITQEAQEDMIPLYRETFNDDYTFEFAPNNPTEATIANGLLTLVHRNWKYAKEIKIINDILDPVKGEAIQIISIHSRNIHLVNLHLNYNDSLTQARKVKEKCKELLGPMSSISLIGGDLNASKDVYRQFQWIGYENIFDESDEEKIIPSYYPDSHDQKLNSSIDHIFYDPQQMTLVECGKAWNDRDRSLEDALSILGSDHIYIWAKFHFIQD